MLTRSLTAAAAAAVVAALAAAPLAAPPTASASSSQVSIVQDDAQLIYATPSQMGATLRLTAALGVDEVKVSLVWALVAPNPKSGSAPRFDGSDPAAYPPGAWDRYDMLVRMAREIGLRVYFELSPADPRWAVDRTQPLGQGPSLGQAPDPRLLAQFVEAVGRRYSGSYLAPAPAGMPSAASLGARAPIYATAPAIPRVSTWGIWNEPNEIPWLNPWVRRLPGGHFARVEPALYRGVLDAAWRGLQASGHTPRSDTILFGELANRGIFTPVGFVRALYCIDASGRPLRGRAATRVGCPGSGNRGAFVAAHPALFEASGLAHHPYGFDVAPDRRYPVASWITLADVGALQRALDQCLRAYHRPRPGGMPIYLSEWGYKTRPPNPFSNTSLTDQQTWLDEGDYLAWRLPYIRSIAQFLIRDTGPKVGERRGSRQYWSTFQTGLEYADGRPKPALLTYRLPIWVPHPRHGGSVEVWGQLRDSGAAAGQGVAIEFQPRGSGAWHAVGASLLRDGEGFLDTRVALPGPGAVRLAWFDAPVGLVIYSRVVGIG